MPFTPMPGLGNGKCLRHWEPIIWHKSNRNEHHSGAPVWPGSTPCVTLEKSLNFSEPWLLQVEVAASQGLRG